MVRSPRNISDRIKDLVTTKKLFSFWRKGKNDAPHGCSSELSTSMASPAPSPSAGEEHHLQGKHIKKLHKAASVGNVQKLKKHLDHKKHDVNGRDKRNR